MKKERILACTIMFVMIFFTFAGCTTAPASSESTPAAKAVSTTTPTRSDPITLRLWAGVQPEYGYDAMAKKFNEQFKDKGISMEYVRYVNDNSGNLQLDTYLMSGGEIDIFLGYGGNGRQIPRKNAGLLLDMTDGFAKRGFDPIKELGDANVSGYLIDGRAYGVPTKYENACYWFANADMFKEAGIKLPINGWTYSQFEAAAKKLTKGEGINKIYALYWGVKLDSNLYRAYITDVLGDYAIYKDDAATETNFDNPVWKAGLQSIINTMLVDKTAISIADEIGNNLTLPNTFLEGKAAMSVGMSQIRIVKDVATYPHTFQTALIPAPVPNEEYLKNFGTHSNRLGAGDLIHVSSKTKYTEQALDAVVWYIKEGMAPLAGGGRIPLWNGFAKQGIIDSMMEGAAGVFNIDSLTAYLSLDKTLAKRPLERPEITNIGTVINEETQAAMYGKKSVDQALKDMKTRADKLIKDQAKK